MENLILGICILIAAIIWALITAWKIKKGLPLTNNSNTNIVLKFPDDAKRLESLPAGENFDEKTIEGQKAILWWTVYKATMDNGYEDAEGCANAANEAVDKVF